MSSSATTDSLTEILRRLDECCEPLDEHEVFGEIVKAQPGEVDEKIEGNAQLAAERDAFAFCPEYRWREGGANWESYYGPMFGGTNADGKPVYSPDIAQLEAKTFDYWGMRAKESKHPVLKVRYADLCWEFQKRITGVGPPIDLPRIVVDSTLDAVTRGLAKHEMGIRRKLARALLVAISIGDSARVAAVRDAVVKHEDDVARDELPGLCGTSFDLIVENDKVPRTPELERKIISDLESRLQRLLSPVDVRQENAWNAQYVAVRLATYYRRNRKQDDVRRVLTLYGGLFERLSENSKGILASGWLRDVHARYRQFGLNEEAERLLIKVHEYSKKSRDEMASYSDSIEIPRAEIDQFLNALVQGTLSNSLGRLSAQFVPNKDRVIELLKSLRESAPLTSMLSMTIVDGDGRPTAQIGGVDDDLDGRTLHQIAQNLQFEQIFLHLGIDHIRKTFSPSAQDVLDYLTQSPVFADDAKPILLVGLIAYLNGDHISAAHVLVARIESAVREIVSRCGGNTLKPHRGGGLMLKNLDELLRDSIVKTCLSENVVLYFRALLTDNRGWNVRNHVSHGIMPADNFGRGMTDRLLHALLILCQLRAATKSPDSTEDK